MKTPGGEEVDSPHSTRPSVGDDQSKSCQQVRVTRPQYEQLPASCTRSTPAADWRFCRVSLPISFSVKNLRFAQPRIREFCRGQTYGVTFDMFAQGGWKGENACDLLQVPDVPGHEAEGTPERRPGTFEKFIVNRSGEVVARLWVPARSRMRLRSWKSSSANGAKAAGYWPRGRPNNPAAPEVAGEH